jgi:CubicO group peptidase (beta-lactamase class C family)
MQGFPPPLSARPTLENWDLPPFNRWTFQNVRRVLPTEAIARGEGAPSPLPAAPQDLAGLAVTDHKGGKTTFGQLLEATDTDGCLVLHRGRVIFERYLNGMTLRSLHLSQSVGKSVVSTVLGALWGQGQIDLEKPVQHYVPELANCGYRDALVRQVLDMRSGVKFDEENYADTDAEIGMLDRASLWKPQRPGEPEAVPDLILWLKQDRPHGGQFQYRSIETEVLGWILSRVSGFSLAELTSRALWGPMGAESEANFTVDRAGFGLASGGLNAALRDYGRVGQLMLDEGYINGRQIVPAAWVQQCRAGDPAAFSAYRQKNPDSSHTAYSRQWWGGEGGRIAALGIFGQMIWIDPGDQLVVVSLASWPDYLEPDRRAAMFRACQAIGKALNL